MSGLLIAVSLVVPVQAKESGVTMSALYLKLPLSFVRNDGQMDSSILFYEQGSGRATAFTKDGITLFLDRLATATVGTASEAVTLTPMHASSFTVEAADRMPGTVNYLVGRDPSKWRTDIPTYGAVLYRGVYPGIDMKIYGTNSELEYDLVVAPGADPSQIHFSYHGIEKLSLTPGGDLEILLRDGALSQKRPAIYQTVNGKRIEIPGRFVLADATTYGFEIGPHDKAAPLTIDPVLVYSTYLGGNYADYVRGIAVDSSGCAYVAGNTSSTNFPTLNPLQGAIINPVYNDAFITKFNAAGDGLIYSTYLGGDGSDIAVDIAVDSSGYACVAGTTASSDFPTFNGYQGANPNPAYTHGFVAKLNTNGNGLVYSTYLGGSDATDYPGGIAVDGSGQAYVVGRTNSTTFPTKNPYQGSTGGGPQDAFVTKFSALGNELVYSTYLGGSANDIATAIAVDSSGNAYVTGSTLSTNYPTKNPVQGSMGGGGDAFVTKFNPAGNALVYSTYLGGSAVETCQAIALDASRNAYVGGTTTSTDFPIKNPFQAATAGSQDAFVTKLNPLGEALVYSTYLGGKSSEQAYGIAVDSLGSAYVSGFTNSPDFPTKNPYQVAHAGGYGDAFVAKLSPAGYALLDSTYLGGTYAESGLAIALDFSGNAYVAGNTASFDFPRLNPLPGAFGGPSDGFVTKLGYTPDLVITAVDDPPVALITGETFPATDTVENLGGIPAASSTTRYYFSATTGMTGAKLLTGLRSVDPLVYGASSSGTVDVTIPSGIASGAYYLLACADDLVVVSEGNETNNCAASTSTVVLTTPDLVESTLTNPPAACLSGSSFAATDTAENQGDAPAGASTTRYYFSRTARRTGARILTGVRAIPALTIGAFSAGKATLTVPLTIPPGTYYLLACADDGNAVAEEEETNNCVASKSATVLTPASDLVEASLSNPPAAAVPGQSFSVTDKVKNEGNAAETSATTTRYYLSLSTAKASASLLTGKRPVPALAAGASSSGTVKVAVPSGIASGTYYLLACADDTGVVIEGNEKNNCLAAATVVLATPDLIEASVGNPPPAASAGDTIPVTDTVQNQGDAPAGKSVTRYYLSTSRTKGSGAKLLAGSRSIPLLAPAATSSGTVDVTIPAGTAPAKYYLLACADAGNKVIEAVETNNCSASVTKVSVGR